MLDIKSIKSNPDLLKQAMKKRNKDLDIDHILDIEEKRCSLLYETEQMKAEQNIASKKISTMKKEGADTTEIFDRMKVISEKIKENDKIIKDYEQQIETFLLNIPNIPYDIVPEGKDSDENIEVKKHGTPKSFDFTPLPHWDLGEYLGILDPERAAKVTGARFHFYKGLGAGLERAIINFYLDTHIKNGYTEIFPPFMANRKSMTGTGQLPKFEEDAFKLADSDYFLIPTAEVPVTNFHADEILSEQELPIKYCAYSACFRAEAGSAGRDTRGLIRQHQFNKVELVKFCTPETALDELDELLTSAERVLQLLELPYRIVRLCGGDLGFSSAITYDIEVWMPSYNRYVEISSCSCFTDYQARRANIKYRKSAKDKAQFVYTLNGSGVAIGRTVAAVLENYQTKEGTVEIPKVLQPYLGGKNIISK